MKKILIYVLTYLVIVSALSACSSKSLFTSSKKDGSDFSYSTQMSIVENIPSNIRFISNPDKDIQLYSVKKSPWCIKFIENPTKEVQLIAVKHNGGYIRYIKNPDIDVQREALKQDSRNLKYITKPSIALIE